MTGSCLNSSMWAVESDRNREGDVTKKNRKRSMKKNGLNDCGRRTPRGTRHGPVGRTCAALSFAPVSVAVGVVEGCEAHACKKRHCQLACTATRGSVFRRNGRWLPAAYRYVRTRSLDLKMSVRGGFSLREKLSRIDTIATCFSK